MTTTTRTKRKYNKGAKMMKRLMNLNRMLKNRKNAYKRSSMEKVRQLKSIRVKNTGLSTTFHSIKNVSIPKGSYKQLIDRYKAGAKNIYNLNQNCVVSLTASTQQYAQLFIGSIQYLKNSLVAAGIYPTSIGSVVNTARTLFTKIRCEYVMTNSSNAPCLLDLYHMQCKHDTVEDPATLWNYGFKDQTAQTAIDYTKYYGTNPLDSVGVTTYWRCRDIVHITLNPGQVR